MTLTASGVNKAPVGSTAVRGFIEAAQPLLGLHGHVHEGKGSAMIGRTLCVNPGSDYTEGTLSAAIVEIADGRVAESPVRQRVNARCDSIDSTAWSRNDEGR